MGNHKVLTDRQVFRTSVLENVALAMMLAPFVAAKLAGSYHLLSFFLGLLLIVLYGMYICFISEKIRGSFEDTLVTEHGTMGRIAGVIYYFRFYLKAALYILLLGEIVSTYMLLNVNKWVVIVSFVLVCFYGASRSVVGRARMLEMLFLWMVVPLILVAVFSINSVDIMKNSDFAIPALDDLGFGHGVNILVGGYGILLLLQSMEIMLFTLCRARNNSRSNALKTIAWIGITIFMAYIFIIGILGRNWIVSDWQASFNVMEAAALPGKTFDRLDYLVLSFLMIGVLATVSGYIAYGGRLLDRVAGSAGRWWQGVVMLVTLTAMIALWCVKEIRKVLLVYMFFGDLPLGLLLPLIAILPGNRFGNKGEQ